MNRFSFINVAGIVLAIQLSVEASANTYYVATSGSDDRSCSQAQDSSTPRRTINAGIDCIGAGDTLHIGGGTYIEEIDNAVRPMPTATSWDSPITIEGDANDRPILLSSDSEVVIRFTTPGPDRANEYYIFRNLIVDGSNINGIASLIGLGGGGNGGTVAHFRFENLEVRNSPGNGLITGADDTTVSHCEFHHNGRAGCVNDPANPLGWTFVEDQPAGYGCGHALYISSNFNLVENSSIHDNGEYAVHVYSYGHSPTGTVVRGNRIFHNNLNTTRYGQRNGVGIILAGISNMAYNNVVFDNDSGIGVSYGAADNNLVFNNTVYANARDGINLCYQQNTYIKNNILFANGQSDIADCGPPYNYNPPILENNLLTDPLFVDAAGGDFHLLPGSPAIDAGVFLSEVPTDIDGASRPLGGAFDIGAYESGGQGPDPTPGPQNDTVAPSVTITSPLDGSAVARRSLITATAN